MKNKIYYFPTNLYSIHGINELITVYNENVNIIIKEKYERKTYN